MLIGFGLGDTFDRDRCTPWPMEREIVFRRLLNWVAPPTAQGVEHDTTSLQEIPGSRWDPAPPTLRHTIAAGLLLTVMGVVAANALFGWPLFGSFSKQALAIVALFGATMMTYFMPFVRHR
jgi:hypothetical protein